MPTNSDEPAPSPPSPLRLFNVFAKSPEGLEKCYYSVPISIHTYFFRRLFAGRRGIYQELISPFIQKLYVECQRRGLRDERAVWDKANESIVAGILADLNFEVVRPSVPVPKRSSSKRRAATRPDEPSRQPKPSPCD